MHQIKLIWDFRGPHAIQTARHHAIHLKEYVDIEKLELDNTGYEVISEMHSIAFMIVNESDMATVRDALKPHRGQLYNSQKD